ncbi:transposase [Jiella sp. MQZ13P-4]|uniref:Transposase n=1 Tax=Jiella sonneratiae TaxID=2816856 RepID=A0ABS3IYD8_9HYPH|nr:transposase [Jiella sonneratiae]
MRLIAGPDQKNDMARAKELIEGIAADKTVADKGYDADSLAEAIVDKGGEAVIPPRRCRKTPRDDDKDLYKERKIVERFFNKLKQFRPVATRYDKLLANYLGFVKLAAVAIWIR